MLGFLIVLIVFVITAIILIQISSAKRSKLTWVETNAEITASEFSSHTSGNDIRRARGESSRKVKLTVTFKLKNGETYQATRKVWTATKNRSMFEQGKWVSIDYAEEDPKIFRLHYQL